MSKEIEDAVSIIRKSKEVIESLRRQLANSQKREVMLREWIKQQGEETNTCTFNILRDVCNDCACHRAKEQK